MRRAGDRRFGRRRSTIKINPSFTDERRPSPPPLPPPSSPHWDRGKGNWELGIGKVGKDWWRGEKQYLNNPCFKTALVFSRLLSACVFGCAYSNSNPQQQQTCASDTILILFCLSFFFSFFLLFFFFFLYGYITSSIICYQQQSRPLIGPPPFPLSPPASIIIRSTSRIYIYISRLLWFGT